MKYRLDAGSNVTPVTLGPAVSTALVGTPPDVCGLPGLEGAAIVQYFGTAMSSGRPWASRMPARAVARLSRYEPGVASPATLLTSRRNEPLGLRVRVAP